MKDFYTSGSRRILEAHERGATSHTELSRYAKLRILAAYLTLDTQELDGAKTERDARLLRVFDKATIEALEAAVTAKADAQDTGNAYRQLKAQAAAVTFTNLLIGKLMASANDEIDSALTSLDITGDF